MTTSQCSDRNPSQSQAFRTNRDGDIANDIGIALVDDINGEINVATPSGWCARCP